MTSNKQTVATFAVNNATYSLTVEFNANGTWTAAGPHEMRDFASRAVAVKWLKKVYASPGVEVAWSCC